MLLRSENSLPWSSRADWTPPSILRVPEVLTESEVVDAEAELKALERHAFAIVKSGDRIE